MARLKEGNWQILLHHQTKTAKGEIAAGVEKHVRDHMEWLIVGLKKVPEPHISNALKENRVKDMIQGLIVDWPRNARMNELDNEIRAKLMEIDTLKKNAMEAKNRNKIKSLRRRVTMLQDEYHGYDKTIDQRRLDLAFFMASTGMEYIRDKYNHYLGDPEAFAKEGIDLQKTTAVLGSMTASMPRLAHIRLAAIEWDRNHAPMQKKEK